MRTRVMATGFEPTDAIRLFAHRALETLNRSHADELIHADVFLEDVNGPKGGEDKAVRVRVKLRNGRTVTVRESRADLYAAITVAARRATFTVRRTLGESRRIDRRRGRSARRGALVDPMEAQMPELAPTGT